MDARRRQAREYLENCTLSEYKNLINEIRLSDRQTRILDMHLGPKRRMNFQIAMDLYISPETVRNELKRIYEKVYRVI